MKVLIVEDDSNKLTRVREFVQLQLPDSDVLERRSYQSGLKCIIDSRPQVILLDMAMPTYDVTLSEKGGRPRPFAGRDILVQMKRRHLAGCVIVVTQYETFGEGADQRSLAQLDVQLRLEFSGLYCGAVFYHAAETDWRVQLGQHLTKASTGGR